MLTFSRWLQSFRIWFGLCVCAIFALIAAVPEFYALCTHSRLRGAQPGMRRTRTGRWFNRWTRRFLHLCGSIGGLRWRVAAARTLTEAEKHGGCIVVANHHGGFDALLVSELLHRMGIDDYRVVAMHEVNWIPLINHVFREAGCAFVKRKGDPGDVERIRKFAEACREDGAAALIFPEGHISESGELLPPRPNGLRKMLAAMPGKPVISMTIRWHDHCMPPISLLGMIPPGTRVTVTARVVYGVTPENADEWLKNEWLRKEAILSAPAA